VNVTGQVEGRKSRAESRAVELIAWQMPVP